MIQSSDSNTATSTIQPTIHLPLEQLVLMLRREGFFVKPDDYIELLKVVEKFSTDNPTDLKSKLCPLIATNEEEQIKFYKVFDEYVRISINPPKLPDLPPPPIPRWKNYIPWFILLLVALGVLLYLTGKPPVVNPSFTIAVQDTDGNTYLNAVIGDTAFLDASATFGHRISDTEKINWRWNLGNGWEKPNSLKVKVACNKEDRIRIMLETASGPNNSIIKTDTQFLKVCTSIAGAIISSDEEEPALGKTITLAPRFRGDTSLKKGMWSLNGNMVEALATTFRYQFSSPGNYSFRFTPGPAGSFEECNQPIETSFEISDTVNSVQLTALPAGNSSPPNPYKFNGWWIATAILFFLTSLLIAFLKQRRARKKAITSIPVIPDQRTESVFTPPYEVPLENKDFLWVARNSEMNPFFRSLRNKMEDDNQALNVPKTIQSVIRSGGIPSLIFTNTLKSQEYLLLIDQSNPKSQQLKLFEYFCKVLSDESVNIERFYYSSFELFKNENYPHGISLKRLSELYKTNTLIIFGNAWQLVYPAYPVLDKEIAEQLQEWEYKAILTPVAYRDWGLKENLIKKSFILLPADSEGQVRLMEAIKEKQLQHDKYLASFPHFYETSGYNLLSITDIKEYLGDEVLFQWLCAVCVYPRLRWEIVIEMGKLVCGKYHQSEKLNYINLLKLVRIPWMVEGSFPEKTRLELLKQLTVDNELAARAQILEMLKYSDLYFRDNYFFSEEKKLQQLTNQFVLFANDKNKYPEFHLAEQQFKRRWQQNKIFDGPLKVYLDKPGGDRWHTPVTENGKNPGLSDYFNAGDKKVLSGVNSKYNAFYISCGILLLLLGLFFNRGKILNSSLAQSLQLSIADSSVNKTIYFRLFPDSCINNTDSFASRVKGTFTSGNNSLPFSFASNGIGNIPLSSTQLAQNTNSLTLQWSDSSQITLNNLAIISDTTKLQLSGLCKTTLIKSPLYIRYNNKSAYNLIEQLIKSLSSTYTVTAEVAEFSDSSRIVYYARNNAAEYASLAEKIKKSFGINLKTEFIEENRTPPAVPILFVNVAGPSCNTIALSDLPQYINEVWRGPGNNRLMNINLARKTIWYSTGDNTSYGTYFITDACRTGTGAYKLTTKTDKGYKVFFLRNTQSQSVELSVCQNLVSSKEEIANLAETACDAYNKMIPYYEVNNNYIYLPVNGGSLLSREATKLKEVALKISGRQGNNANPRVSQSNSNDASTFTLTVTENRSYVTASGINTVGKYLNNYKINYTPKNSDFITLPGTNPFKRNYMTITVSGTDLSKDPCRITYKSLTEAIKQPGLVCRLDLSNQKLELLPAQLTNFKQLQYIDVRNNLLTAKDSLALNRLFPKAQVLFYPQQQPTAPEKWELLKRISLTNNNDADNASSDFLKSLNIEMKQNPLERIKLVTYYNPKEDSKNASVRLQNFLAILEKKYGFSDYARRITTEVKQEEYSQANNKANIPNQSQQNKIGAPVFYIDVFGQNLNRQSAK